VTFRVEALVDQDVSAFTCGHPELDTWLRTHARTATGQGIRTYVLVDGTEAVVGYFAIAPHVLARAEVPARVVRGAPDRIPAILLAKLALASALQGSGLGAELLLAALAQIVEAGRRVGGRIVVVDAIDDAARRFYEHHHFVPLPDHPRRLILKLSAAAAVLDVPWP